MAQPRTRDRRKSRILPLLIWIGVAGYALTWTGTRLVYGEIINGYAAFAYLVLIACTASLLSDWLWYLGNHYDQSEALTPGDNKGTARFVHSREEIAHEVKETGWGPYWGVFVRELIADFNSNAMVLGPAGSGKTSAVVLPTILSIRTSKTITDLKPELVFVTARALRERGETVRILNIGDVKEDLVGETDQYNPLCIVADNFERAGGLHDVTADVHEITIQLKPEPDKAAGGASNNEYFEIGSRDLIGFAIQICVLVRGPGATLGDVAELLNDKEALLRHAQWACGKLEQVAEDE